MAPRSESLGGDAPKSLPHEFRYECVIMQVTNVRWAADFNLRGTRWGQGKEEGEKTGKRGVR